MKTTHKIIIGDSRRMDDISDESVHLVVTSPPYWQLKDYGHENQIGFNDSYEDYINNLNLVWNECYRVLFPGCRLCVNIGDQFARAVYYGRYKVIPIRTEIIKFCETIGFDYMGAIIWQKVTTTNTTGGATVMGSFPYPRNGIIKIDYEFILIFKKLGQPPRPTNEAKELSKLTTSEWNEYFTGHWNFGGERQDGHLAMFPEELPKRLIRMFTFVGDMILDPFLGSGTTSLAAKNLLRNSVGYEINSEFLPIIQSKLGITPLGLASDQSVFDFHIKPSITRDYTKEIEALPYQFKDKVQFDKKIDPKKLTFGSKVDQNSPQEKKFFRVARVISPEILELNDGVKIRLIGINAIEEKKMEAIQFLESTLKGQQVYSRFDEQKYDTNDTLLVYLYLRNGTFINASLIRQGLARVHADFEFKFRKRLLKYQGTSKK